MSAQVCTDMMGREITLSHPPKRIISLVPSQTELLYDLGLTEEVVGITKFCVHPTEWYRNKKRIGGTKNINIPLIRSLQPDLVIANKEENEKEQIEELSSICPVWISNIQSIEESFQMISEVGILVGKGRNANALIHEIKYGFENLKKGQSKRVAYFIWRKPWMCAGGDTFINSMIEKMGWVNVLADKMRYPEVLLEELVDKNIDKVLLSSEPYPFKEAHIEEIRSVLPGVEVLLVDGEMFSWYGSRLKEAVKYLQSLI